MKGACSHAATRAQGAGSAFDTPETAARLHEQIKATMQLAERVQAVDKALGVTKSYLKKVRAAYRPHHATPTASSHMGVWC